MANPNGSRVHCHNPASVLNAVNFLSCSLSLICQYPEHTSRKLSVVSSAKLSSTSYDLGSGCASWRKNRLTVAVECTPTLHSPSLNDTGAGHGEHQSSIPLSSSSCVSALMMAFSCGEYRLGLHFTGVGLGSTNLITPSNPFMIPGVLGFFATTMCIAHRRHALLQLWG